MTTWEKFCEIQRVNGPVNVFSHININTDKESETGLLLTSVNTGGSVVDNVITNDRAVSSKSEQVACTSSAVDSKVVSCADARSVSDDLHESSIQHIQCAGEGVIWQGRIVREPIDRARYVVVNGSSGTMFACSRCSKQYIHRKSLNKHWNDKHADDGIDSGGKSLPFGICSGSEPRRSLFSMVSVTKHEALSSRSSVIRSAIHSYALCSPTCSVEPVSYSRPKIYSDRIRSEAKHTGNIRESVLWHSLTAIHSNQEHDLNSFCCAPMPAHIGGHYNARESFANQVFCDDDCQVLDLSKGSSGVREQSNISLPDAPLDLSLKSDSTCLSASERAALSLHGVVETATKSVSTYSKDISVADTLVLNKAKRADDLVAKSGNSVKDIELVQLDSVAVLRRLHSGILTSATNQSVLEESVSHNAAAVISDEMKVAHAELEPSAKCECHPDLMHFKNNLNVTAKIPDDLATSEETYNFFGGISRGGHIRCKVCDFTATSMLLFSRHVARHARKPNILSGICDGVQNQCCDGRDKLENRFFAWLGLYRTDGADGDQKSRDRCCYGEADSLDMDENLKSRCNAVATDVSEFIMPEVQTNGFERYHDGESGLQKKNCSTYSVRQKRYQRGFGLTTTESRDAAGRSWRRRRLRTCERCGYVTDNLTTLRRHEVKHGALGMYRCKLCDYTVNQQHILEYHTRSVHGFRQIGPVHSTTVEHTVDNIGEHRGKTTAVLVEGDRQRSSSEDLSEIVSTGDSAVVQGGSRSYQVADLCGIPCAVNKCSMQNMMSKSVQYSASVTVARRHLLDAFSLQLGRGVCVRCGFRSLSTVRMKQHMLRHPHERHACSLCAHTSLTARLLLKHKRQHTDCRAHKKAYECPECPFIAASPHRLQCHTQFHGVKFRRVCGKCSYSIDRANLMAQHRRLHVSASASLLKRCWLRCSKCPFKTISRVTLVYHERGHYAMNCRYVCSLCTFGTDIANVALGHHRLH